MCGKEPTDPSRMTTGGDSCSSSQHATLVDLLKGNPTAAFSSALLDFIFQHPAADIVQALEEHVSFADMQEIRGKLFERLRAVFPSLQEKRLINRQSKRTLAPSSAKRSQEIWTRYLLRQEPTRHHHDLRPQETSPKKSQPES